MDRQTATAAAAAAIAAKTMSRLVELMAPHPHVLDPPRLSQSWQGNHQLGRPTPAQ
jgi:hypothetical protein